jgi:hypothetical protein
LVPPVKWLVAFRNSNLNRSTSFISIREFQCGGYYEAFERVLGYAARTNAELLWFKEKRECDESFAYSVQLPLGLICAYCNVEHRTEDSIPCEVPHCNSIVCSRKCHEHHMLLKHPNSDSH